MSASWWAVFWPLALLTASTTLLAGSLAVAVVVPVRAVLHRDADWLDVGTTVAAFLLCLAAIAGAGVALTTLGLG